ncbi:ANTAR domain-containing protein [Streptomyces sp. NPDC047123]|uniref:ANTAR domain-containing protein n=1 Tax=Streptomyces sp. NPDC047123 TaxID=3155622 RepID=UPI0033F5F636
MTSPRPAACATGTTAPRRRSSTTSARSLRTRPVVDQASGIVMHVLGCDARAAFGVPRPLSRTGNRKLADVAAAPVDTQGRGLARDLVPPPR